MSFVLCAWGSFIFFFVFKQKTAYEMRISDWSSDVCSSDLLDRIEADAVHPLDDRQHHGRRHACRPQALMPVAQGRIDDADFGHALLDCPVATRRMEEG